MKQNEIIKRINNILGYLETHNKNYTKNQYQCILELQDLIHELDNINA